MNDLKKRLEQRKTIILKEIEAAARHAESKKLQRLTSDLKTVDTLLVKHAAFVVEAETTLRGFKPAKSRRGMGEAVRMLRSNVGIQG